MSNQWSVYKHTSPSGKIYIGIAKDIKHRWRNKGSGYKGSTRIANAIKKYGWDNIKHEILFSNLTKEDACQKEIELIKRFNSTDPAFGYNLLSGGQCGLHSAETKEKIKKSKAAKKYGVTSQAISHACTGRTRTCCGMVWNEEKRPDLMDIPARMNDE